MRCGAGKKSSDLENVKQEVMGTAYLSQEKSDNIVIVEAKHDTSWNLMTHAAAYDDVYSSIVIPAQN